MSRSSRFSAAVAAFTAFLVVLPSSSASAQYFGQNKVQYKDLKFQILKTEHFDIYYYATEQDGVQLSARLAERWYARLSRIFNHQLRGRQPLVLYASHADFEQTNTIQGELGEGTGGVTEPLKRRIILPLAGPLSDTDHVIGHELVHAFQYDMTTMPNAPAGQNGAERLPLWFIEGMAEYFSLGPVDPNTAMWLRDAAREQKLPSIKDLDNPKYFPYRWGQALWAYIDGRFGVEVIRQMLVIGGRGSADLDPLFKQLLGEDMKQLSTEWQASIHEAYDPVLAATTPPSEIGRMVIRGTELGGQLNVGPSISPDGKLIAFLSERSVFSIDLYIADASNGKILRRLTSNATDPHYSSIQFIYSAGAWDASSTRIAIATVTSGRPALAVYDAVSGNKEREVRLDTLDEIFNPTWAPDGHAICFTGMSQGLTDLWIYDLNASKLQRLTNDPYADLQPAWSPDGQRIAFATDRFSSNLDTLAIGGYRLATIDPQTGAIEQVKAFTDGKNINPQWAPDSRSLYFVSDRDGISNLYRFAFAGGELTQLTRVGTGLSGITNTSPVLSIAAGSGVAAFSVYENGRYDIFTIDPSERTRTGGLTAASMRAATLPPVDRRPSEVAALLADATVGLPPPQTKGETVAYKPKLTLEGMGQPTVAVGADRFGAAVGGGVSLLFSDMLGDHTLGVAFQISQGIGGYSFNDTAAQVAYINQAHRWNWGVVGGQIPYLSGGFSTGVIDTSSGDAVETDQTTLFRQTERSAALMTAYPFDRARRVEFQGGITQVSFDQVVQTQSFSLTTGQLLTNNTQTSSAGPSLTLGTTAAAFVSDTSNYGATSPVQGQRYRLEASPTFGTINFAGLLADYRRYFMPAPFYTIATRVMHYGRYGGGGEDPRLFPLFLGYPNLVRGYDVNSFDASECVPNATSSCPVFDRLLGSRVLVGNVEFRFPLLRPFGLRERMYGPVPIEVAFFADGGAAWNGGERPFTSSRPGIASVGTTLRVNVFGYVPLEFDFARPLQRPAAGWIFQFNISPGW